jgi:hypothetical protein
MDNELQVKYDHLCYITFVNIQTKTLSADRIVLRNFHHDNKEHLFVLAIANACSSVLGDRDIAVDEGFFTRTRLSRKFGKRKVYQAKDSEQVYLDVEDVLELMRGHACEMCGESFTFGDIYDAYYSGKDA